MSERTETLLRSVFTETIQSALVAAISSAYDLNMERYAPEVGDDAMLFGLMNYKSKVHFLTRLGVDASKDWVTVIRQTPSFEFKIGNYKLSAYCAGHTSTVEPRNAFPYNRNRAARIVETNRNQLSFPFAISGKEAPDVDDSKCPELVLADIGNPLEGLLKVFLAVPIEKDEDGRITRWGTILEIWNKASHERPRVASGTPSPPPEPIKEPVVTLRTNTVERER